MAAWTATTLGGMKQWRCRDSRGTFRIVHWSPKAPSVYRAQTIGTDGKLRTLGHAPTLSAAKAVALGVKSNPKKRTAKEVDYGYKTHVYGIPQDGSAPFLMFIAESGDAYAHQNVQATRRYYTQPIAAYELRNKDGVRRFAIDGAKSNPKRNPAGYIASQLVARAGRIYSDFGTGPTRWVVSLSAPFKHDKRLNWGVEGQGATDDQAIQRLRADAMNHGYDLPPAALLLVRRAIMHAVTSDSGHGEVRAGTAAKSNPKPLSKKALDRLIEQIYYKHASGLQINIMDIGKVFKMGEQAYAAGGDVEQAVKDAIKLYCVKGNPKKNPGARRNPATNASAVLEGYLEAALWSSTDDDTGEPLNSNFSVSDIKGKTLAKLKGYVTKFLAAAKGLDLSGYRASQVGHDLWLTQNGHGAGFWDGDYEEPPGLGYKLDRIAQSLGEVNLYVGDDGKLYV